jgi:hypothetical protein
MGVPTVKTAVVFRPKRNWKPKRRDRNVTRRKKRKRWWRKNRHRLAIKRRQRQRRLKNNSMFKAWRKKRQREKVKRRMRFASLPGSFPAPESWFIFRDEAPFDIDLGYVKDYDPDAEELLIYDVDENEERVVGLDDFLTHSEFLEESDIANFLLYMDQFYGEQVDDLDIVEDEEQASREFEVLPVQAIIERVARSWLMRKAGFG